MNEEELEVGNPETFLGEFETMDLSELKDKMFMVAISTGDPEKGKFICESLHGPYGFYEMAEQVERLWKTNLVHAKVLLTSKNMSKPPQYLDSCTIDYLEAQGGQVITEGMLNGEDLVSEYTCKAGIMDGENCEILNPTKDEDTDA